ncbi:MAG: Chromosome partition protein Smc [Verrucomicrobiota bacterium]|jgi:WD40 repeat protein
MKRVCILPFLTFAALPILAAPLPVADVKRDGPVDFHRDLRPFLSDNCFSCHCQTTTKGGLNMETPEAMLKGGDTGPAVVAGKSGESLLMTAAAHLDEDLAMPPRDNKAKAKNLTPDQLGLLKLWIDQGAKPSQKTDRSLAWQPIAPNLGAIFAVAVSPDGQFAACSRANRIFIYHIPSGALVASEVAHRDHVNSLAFSPDGRLLASGGYREVKIWGRVAEDGCTAQALPPAEPLKLARADGKMLALLNAEGKPAGQVDHGEVIAAFAVRADGKRFATAGGSVAKLWSADGKLVAELRGNRYADELVAERDRALQVATGTVAYRKEAVQSAEKTLAATQERIKKATEALAPKQTDLAAKQKAAADAKAAMTAIEQSLATAEADFKKADEKLVASADKAAQAAAKAVEAIKGAVAVDAVKVATDAAAALQEAARIRAERDTSDAARKDAAKKLEPAKKLFADADAALKKSEAAKSAGDTEIELAKAEEKKNMVAVAEVKTAVDVAEAERKKAEEALQSSRDAAKAAVQPVKAIAFSPDGTTLVTAGDDQLIHTWSAETGAAFDVLAGQKAGITSLAFAPNADLIATAGDKSLAWNLTPRWKLERTIGTGDAGSPLTDRVNAVAFSRDGQQLATGSGEPSRDGELKLWNVANGQLVRDFPRIHSDSICSIEFSPDGKLIATGAADKMARITDIAAGKVVRSFEGHTHHVLGVSWSADGRTVASAGAEGMVKVWDFVTGDRKKNIEGFEKEVTAVRFVAASANLLTSSGDSRVRLVALDGKEVRAFPEVADFMQSAAASADGKFVVAGGQDSVLRVWNGLDGKAVAKFPGEPAAPQKN